MSNPVDVKLVESIWDEIRSELEKQKKQIYEVIKTYPPPITACDEQFDHLLAEQQRISQELGRLHAASQATLTYRDPTSSIDEFLRSSTCLGDEAEQRIRSLMRQAVRGMK